MMTIGGKRIRRQSSFVIQNRHCPARPAAFAGPAVVIRAALAASQGSGVGGQGAACGKSEIRSQEVRSQKSKAKGQESRVRSRNSTRGVCGEDAETALARDPRALASRDRRRGVSGAGDQGWSEHHGDRAARSVEGLGQLPAATESALWRAGSSGPEFRL